MAGPDPAGSLEGCQAAIPQVKMAGICKSGPSSMSKFGRLAGGSLQHAVEWKSHRSAEQVAEGQGGRGHQKEVKRESLSDKHTEKSPLLLEKVAQRHMQILHYMSAMCINGDNSIWLKTRAGSP